MSFIPVGTLFFYIYRLLKITQKTDSVNTGKKSDILHINFSGKYTFLLQWHEFYQLELFF
jgi:hypothetical protein